MAAPIGPGDFVEAGLLPWQDATSRAGFVPGAIYRVAAVEHEGRHVGLVIANMPPSRHPTGAWASENFKPVYKPRASFISSLHHPAPEREREGV